MLYSYMIDNQKFYLYTGLLAGFYSIFAGFQYYTYSGVNLITSENAKKKIKDNKIKHIIDVRTKVEWDLGHYKSAIHIPGSQISKKNNKIKKIDFDDGILVYCNTGQRARFAAEKLVKIGFKNVYYISGSYKSL